MWQTILGVIKSLPMKTLRIEDDDTLIVERIMHARRYSLILDRNRCIGCEICFLVCPREAIEINKPEKEDGWKKPTITIDENRCQYCGICNAICPLGALTHKINQEERVAVINMECFPEIIREINIETSKCPPDCNECEEACPFNLIRVTVTDEDGRVISREDIESVSDRENLQVNVELDMDHCPCCRLCEIKCPNDALHVKKIISGLIRIENERCEEGCRDCLDICPIPGALYLDDEEKMHANNTLCIYCGICKMVCPVEDAIILERTGIRHTPIRSGAWNRALEKLTSTKGMVKELRSKMISKVKRSVERRV